MKILIIRLSSFGDQLHVLPAIVDLKTQMPKCEIYWLVQPEFSLIPKIHPQVTRVFEIYLRELGQKPWAFHLWRSLIYLIKSLRMEGFDYVIDTQGMLKSALLSFLSGSKIRVGYSKHSISEKLAYVFYHRHFTHRGGSSSVARVRDLFQWTFGLETPSCPPKFGLSNINDGFNKAQSQALLFIPFASKSEKLLPNAVWVNLGQYARKLNPTIQIYLSWGSQEEKTAVDKIRNENPDLFIVCSEKNDSLNLLNFMLGFSAVIGLDTGPTHLANAIGLPTVMIFTATSPQLFFVAGSAQSVALGSEAGGPSVSEIKGQLAKVCNR
jgi:heptosyltransferase-1